MLWTQSQCLRKQILINKEELTIQELARFVGMLVPSVPGVQYGPFVTIKSMCLKSALGNFKATTVLPSARVADLGSNVK